MVLPLPLDNVYRESILGFSSQNALAGERIALVSPTLVSTEFSVLPGFAPAAELVAWCVPKGVTFVVGQKAPKPVTPRLASLERTDGSLWRADQLAPLKQGPPADESVPPLGQTAGVGRWEPNLQYQHPDFNLGDFRLSLHGTRFTEMVED